METPQTSDEKKVSPTTAQVQSTEVKKVEEEKISRLSLFLKFFEIEERRSIVLLSIVLTVTFFSTFISFLVMPPFGFPQGKTITVSKGTSLTDVSVLLSKENIIRSQSLFEFCAKVVGGEKPVAAGQYLFKEPISACNVAYRIAHNISGVPAIRVTIPEGLSNKEISFILAKSIPNFDTAFFIEHARAQEGFLFPDTYFFSENVNAQNVETIMNTTFSKKVDPWSGEIESTKHSLREIVTMASILEKEATTEEDKAIVSGILWNRIAKGMPLQVDAPFMYLLGKKSSELTVADLQIKSSYNTYRNKGLPSGPIGNPGIVAIRSAIHPTTSTYYYYLSDNTGTMHYAKTFEEHVANKTKYLR